ncbi:MAG TPA: hypothetical protein VHY22_03720 [Chthoniobacteraceae bacterium]|nr:hypothetical protein [Chthoniobacteraceae bacterium]
MFALLSKPIDGVRREWAVLLETARSAEFRELLRWCAPALALGLIARAWLTIHFPYGYFQADTPDFLLTAERLLRHHAMVIHGKKSFLAPICFTIPFLLHIPALIVIPMVQHIAGLAATLAAGALVRLWFRCWRWFVIPVTLLYTLNPALLWYEHALLAESHYLFAVTAVALAGTLLVRRPTLRRFVWLIVALFFTAGSRPEGKLFVVFGLGVTALVYAGEWKLWARRMAVMLVCCAGIWMSSRSTQAGLLLYSTVVRWAPQSSSVAPGVEQFVNPIRNADVSIARTKFNSIEEKCDKALHDYLKSAGRNADEGHVSSLAGKLAMEVIRRRIFILPGIAADKFLLTCRENPDGSFDATSGGFSPEWIYEKQQAAMVRRKFMKTLMKGLTGRPMDNSNADVSAFLHAEYQPLSPDWFTPLQAAWNRLTLGYQWHSHGSDKRFVPGWPACYFLCAAGMLASLIPRDRLWRFHWPWLATLLGVWFAVMLTGVVNSRYRFVFEPFCIFYVFLLLDYIAGAFGGLGRRYVRGKGRSRHIRQDQAAA